MKQKPNTWRLAAFLLLVAAFCATLVSWAHGLTQPVIAEMEKAALKNSYAEIYPDLDTVKDTHIDPDGYIQDVLLAEKSGQPEGVIYRVASKGYGGDIDILLAFDIKSQKLTGVKILKQSETPGLGANAEKAAFTAQFAQKDAGEDLKVVKKQPQKASEVEAVTAATITSQAVVRGVNAARQHFEAHYAKGV
jgi:electron transport complex protein RnfG